MFRDKNMRALPSENRSNKIIIKNYRLIDNLLQDINKDTRQSTKIVRPRTLNVIETLQTGQLKGPENLMLSSSNVAPRKSFRAVRMIGRDEMRSDANSQNPQTGKNPR